MKFLPLVFLLACASARNNDERIAKLEERLDKVIKVLDQTLPPEEPDPDQHYAVPIGPNDPVQGPADAKVTIIEGFEFLCPYCYMVNPTVDKILAKYPNDVRLVSKYLIIHGPPAIPPGLFACGAAKQGKYKEMKAALWKQLWGAEGERPSLDRDQAAPEKLEKLAQSVGVDPKRVSDDNHACEEWLTQSEDTLRSFNAAGTPAFFVNGRFISGAQPFEAFDKVIQEELALADRKVKEGVPAGEYYQREVLGKGLKKVKGRFD